MEPRIQRKGDVGGKAEARGSSSVCASRLYTGYFKVREGQCEILFAELPHNRVDLTPAA